MLLSCRLENRVNWISRSSLGHSISHDIQSQIKLLHICVSMSSLWLSKQLVANASLCGADTKDNGVYDNMYVSAYLFFVHTSLYECNYSRYLHENEELFFEYDDVK